MSIALLVVLYAVAFSLLRLLSTADMSPELRFWFGLGGGVAAVFLPIYAFSILDLMLTRRALAHAGRNWCREHNQQFVQVVIHKQYFTLVSEQTGEVVRRKFRAVFVPRTWSVDRIDWL